MWIKAEQYKIVGACLAAARRRATITQQELAARLGKPQSFVSEYERGQRRLDVVELLVIAQALGVDPLPLFAEIATESQGIGTTNASERLIFPETVLTKAVPKC